MQTDVHALVDTHCHLDVPEFDADRDDVVARARAAGVTRQIVPAIEAATWPGLRDACARDDGLFPAYGLHPLLIASHRDEHLRALRDWIERERPVAIGECGLDYWVEDLDRDVQAKYFDGQLQLAREYDLPVVVHARRAVDAVMAAIKRVGQLRGVIHSYAGSEEQARQLADLGFLVGIGGPVTYDRANRVRRVAASIPLDTLLLETDAPDQPNSDRRGQRNEPACITRVLEVIAELRNEDPAVIAHATTQNAERLFGLPRLQ
ncbi:TatD family hydrolase [Lysobacter sp. A6]|uniref:TatD family hydrolase n=1 Tax=Noviluteimonas lactosilytica TaxID=2888523 RepID=A0ABS8JDU5_9GAMM|nr:TatD family hydrolase [Lysobacter lactosilyticus]MCC8361777.1 TatD family hydrolase [Lysobacter lactosilyticus]